MALDPRAKRLLDMLAMNGGSDAAALTIEARRSGLAGLMQLGARPQAVANVSNVVADGRLPMRIYRPEQTVNKTALVFFHGGGLVAGSIATHDGICHALAMSSGAVVISAGYRLAPEHKFPACLDDAGFAVDWIIRQADELGLDAERIAIGGESAGALLAALISGGHSPVTAPLKAQLLLCPVIDLTADLPSRREFATGYGIDAGTVAQDIGHCLPRGMTAAELPSPLRFSLKRPPPPTIIEAAECDPFRDESAQYAEMLERAGIPLSYRCHAGMVHSFHGLPALLPQATPALADAGRVLAQFLA